MQLKPLDSYDKKATKTFRQVFDMFDFNGDGTIDAHELGKVMKGIGVYPSETELQDLMQEFDIDGNGSIDFLEFVNLMTSCNEYNKTAQIREAEAEDLSAEEEIKAAFKVFDIDGNGFISQEELKITLDNLGEHLSDRELRAMMRQADLNNDGQIDYNEFAKMMYQR